MNEVLRATSAAGTGEAKWDELRPVLDAAMHELGETDREAILLRFFEGCSLAEVGAAIGLAENSARMRVDRALEKLREQLARRGITSTTTALGLMLAQQPATALPIGLAASVASGALVGVAASAGGGLTALTIMSIAKLKGAAVALVLAVSIGALVYVQRRAATKIAEASNAVDKHAREVAAHQRENEGLRAELRRVRAETPPAPPSNANIPKTSAERLAELRLMADLQRRGLMRGALTVIEVEGKFQPSWAEIFALTPSEVDRLNRSIAVARQKIGDYEVANATVRTDDKGNIVITVQPFIEGAAIYDELVRTFSEVLGPDRYAAFAALGLKDLEDRLNLLGVGKRTLTLSHNRAAADPKRAYHLTDQIERPDGTRKLGSASDAQFDRVIGFLLGPLTKLVPPDF
jgi:hypothetical protein